MVKLLGTFYLNKLQHRKIIKFQDINSNKVKR